MKGTSVENEGWLASLQAANTPQTEDPTSVKEYSGISELTALYAGGLTSFGLFFTTIAPMISNLDAHAETFGQMMGSRLIGALLISMVGAAVGTSVAHLQDEFYPDDFPQDIPEQI